MKQPATLHDAGVDWATRTHAVCVVDQHGAIRARFEVSNTGKSFTGLCRRLAKLKVAGVAIERPDGPLVEAMLEGGRKVVVVPPRQVKALRSRYRASGAKSDPADAYLLADVLRTDGHRLTPLTPDSDPTKILGALTRTRKDLQEARVALVNQLTSQLERCFPGAIGLFAELHSPIAVAFLRRYPASHAAASLTQAKLAAFLRRLHYPGRTPVPTLLSRIQTAPVAGISPAEAAGRAVCVLALLDAIQVTARQERELEAEIIERLEVHADAKVFTSLPKAGHGVRAAALLGELGDVRARFPDNDCLAALAGAAPVTITSGKRRVVKFRWACDKKLRNALIDFADDSRHASPWAAKVDADALARTGRHPHAVRILARAWIRVIWRLWQDGAAYDPAKHRGAVRLLAA
ncbi:MAG TPA: IS110 family transposase [Actinomycetota bacterium]|nr:IS110 family transposase [Actinomycetota bacterium]